MTNLYLRKRIAAIKALAESLPTERTHKNTDRKLLVSYGHIPENLVAEVEHLIAQNPSTDNSALSFQEISSYNTFFVQHPEKVAGKEIVTTSIHFPIKIVATKEEVQQMIRTAIQTHPNDRERKKKMAIAKARALKIKLALLQI